MVFFIFYVWVWVLGNNNNTLFLVSIPESMFSFTIMVNCEMADFNACSIVYPKMVNIYVFGAIIYFSIVLFQHQIDHYVYRNLNKLDLHNDNFFSEKNYTLKQCDVVAINF